MAIDIVVIQSFACEPEIVISTLSEHQHLDRFFNASFTVLPSHEHYTRRQVSMLGYRFIERVEQVDPFTLNYHIEGDGPVNHHRASINVTPSETGSQLVYSIHCQAKWWQPSWLLQAIIRHDLTQALHKLKEQCDAC